MKFLHRVLHGFEDAQRNFEQLEQYGLWTDTSAAALRSQLGMTRGSGTVTFTASKISAATTVTHGLSSTPTSIQLTAVENLSDANGPLVFSVVNGSAGATTFQAQGYLSAAITGSVSFYWLAIL